MITRSIAWLLPAALIAAPVAIHADDAKVTGITVSHSGGMARLAIAAEGAVKVRQFTLSDPARVVIDVQGAKLDAMVLGIYDGVRRGALRDVRVSQNEVDVVRVVLEFDELPAYRVLDGSDGVIGATWSAEPFGAWRLGAPLVGTEQPAATTREQPRTQPQASTRPGNAPAVSRAADDPPISVNFQNASWPEVAALFARVSGRSIVVGPGVTGEVNAVISNQPWEYVFNAVLASHGYSVAEMPGGILRIDSPGELAKLDSVEVLQTQLVRLNYANADSLAKSIEPLLTPNRGTVVPVPALNGLVITDTRTRLPSITEFVSGMDIRTPTVSISAKLIFVDRTDLQQLGFKYDLGTSQQFFNRLVQRIDPLTGQPYNPNTQIVNLGGNAMSAISNADALISGSALDLAFTTAIGGFSLTAFLSALERVELTDVEAVPVIHTLDNQQAYILSGEETPVRVIDASSFGQVNQAPRANVQFKETGIKLTVTPSVTANREIRMAIEAERSSIQPLAAADLGFTIPKQIASSRLLVRDGQTAVIGGLTTTTVTRNRAGIPLLSSLPFVGSLFSFTENRENRKDLIVMVTPRIVDDPVE